jgi:hypothetical protein
MKDNENAGEVFAEPGEGEPCGFAEREFRAWCGANDIDCAEEDMGEEDRAGFVKIKKRFCRAITEKRLVTDGVKLVYKVSSQSPQAGEEITVRRPTGKDLIAMDGFKDTQQMQKMQAFIASVCGKERSFVARLDGRDYRFLQDAATLFLTA